MQKCLFCTQQDLSVPVVSCMSSCNNSCSISAWNPLVMTTVPVRQTAVQQLEGMCLRL